MEHTHKGYVVWRDKQYCHWHIRHDGKGSIPDVLLGSWMTLTSALSAIDRYRQEVPEVALEAPVEPKVGRPAKA